MENFQNTVGYKEISFRVEDIRDILGNHAFMEKASVQYESALSDFLDYAEKEGFDDDRFFRMTLAPNVFFTDGLRELRRVLEAVKNGDFTLYDDGDEAFSTSKAGESESSMQ